ncbi:MAG: ABC transporter permease [Saprospiraceae bacterium]|nr:ABC transporter permease [Saprospiraceae bacterium]
MEKLFLIIKREYLTRVKKRSFILTTILTPLAFALFFLVVGFIFSYESDDVKRVAILDEAGILESGGVSNERNLVFIPEEKSLEELRQNLESLEYDGILRIPPITNLYAKSYTIFYYSEKPPTLDVETLISSKINKRIEAYKIQELQLDVAQLEALDSKVSINPEPLDENGEDSSQFTGAIGAAIGSFMGIIMYMTVFIYGMMVMRSVMEEKTNRIVEVMISSVRPFQLMLGKIIGVGAVGLTQIAIWAVLIPTLGFLVTLIFGIDTSGMQGMQNMGSGAAQAIDPEDAANMAQQILLAMGELNWGMILVLFLFYFLGGFFLYSSLFAAVGSAMSDDLGESQALTLPITIPVLIAFYIMFAAVQSPNSSLAIWASIFPLFSPIVMPARLAFQPPVWEVALSMGVLIATCILFVWISSRIYRVGILMYGKKVTLRTLGKWIFYKD